MKLTLGQALKMVEVCPKGSYYYLEALRVVNEHGLGLAIDSPNPTYQDINDDDGKGT